MQRKFTKFFQLVHHVFPSCLGEEVSRIEITFLLLSSGNLPGNFSPGKLACGKKNYKTLQNFFSLFPTFPRILELRASNTCCPKIPPTPPIRKSHKMCTHISSLSHINRLPGKDLIIRIKPSSLLPLLNFQQ